MKRNRYLGLLAFYCHLTPTEIDALSLADFEQLCDFVDANQNTGA